LENNQKSENVNDELTVAAICAGLVCIVIVVNLAPTSLIEPNNYTLTFNGDLTHSDGPITLVVDNNNKGNIKKIIIYGSSNSGESKISVSHLMDESHLAIRSTEIKFNNKKSELQLNNLTGEPKIVNVSIENIPPGEYSGALIFSGNPIASVPIKVATEPLIIRALLWVLVGILLSVILWELIHYLTYQQHEHTYKQQKQEIDSNKELHAKYLKHKWWHHYRWSRTGLTRQSIYIIGSAGFAMSIGIISLFTNDFVTGQRVIDPIEIVVLIGIGLGTGSVKEFVDRPPS
jgi:hypothetical protein